MKTKREMRKEAIERLKSAISVEGEHLSYGRVIEVLSGRPTYTEGAGVYAETLIDLLTDDEPNADEYIKLPRDENGEVIHLYDALAGYGYPDGGVVCKAIANGQMILVGRITDTYREWLLWDAYKCHHYKKPTVEEVLREFAIACENTGNAGPEVQRLAAEYAKKLQLKEETCE